MLLQVYRKKFLDWLLHHDKLSFLILSREKQFLLSPFFKFFMTVEEGRNEQKKQLFFIGPKRGTAAQNVII